MSANISASQSPAFQTPVISSSHGIHVDFFHLGKSRYLPHLYRISLVALAAMTSFGLAYASFNLLPVYAARGTLAKLYLIVAGKSLAAGFLSAGAHTLYEGAVLMKNGMADGGREPNRQSYKDCRSFELRALRTHLLYAGITAACGCVGFTAWGAFVLYVVYGRGPFHTG